MGVNFSVSIPSPLVDWLERYAIECGLYTNGKPSVNKAAAKKLEDLYNKEKEVSKA
jgi:Arc/MetJ-type ribon-helix-helix transcriptional regulator